MSEVYYFVKEGATDHFFPQKRYFKTSSDMFPLVSNQLMFYLVNFYEKREIADRASLKKDLLSS